MDIEGKIQFQLFREHDRIKQVVINSSRPVHAARLFIGKSAEETLNLLPLVFHVCATAQAHASVKAFEKALSITPSIKTDIAREMLVWMETAREHLWRILIDWSNFLNSDIDKSAVGTLKDVLPELKKALFSGYKPFSLQSETAINEQSVLDRIDKLEDLLVNTVYAGPLEEWLVVSYRQDLQEWTNNRNTVAVKMLQHVLNIMPDRESRREYSFLPELCDNELNQYMQDDQAGEFLARPLWHGKQYETGTMARQSAHPLVSELLYNSGHDILARIVARLVELASIPEKLRAGFRQLTDEQNAIQDTTAMESGLGFGHVEAARGRLVHRVHLHEGKVQQYQILAPTEWNFHPDGVAARLLKSLPADCEKTLLQQADLLINSIDPCVSYDMVVH